MGTVDPEFLSWYDIGQGVIFFGQLYLYVLLIFIVTAVVFPAKADR